MNIIVNRKIFTAKTTQSDVFIDDIFFGYVLEPTILQCEIMAIPEGTYKIGYYQSPHFGRLMPRVLCDEKYGVILWHWGNWPRDTHGCSLTGSTADIDYVGNSTAKWSEFWAMLGGAPSDVVPAANMKQDVTVTYRKG
jgi:hypothetical protein